MKNVLVTGAAGLIGFNTCKYYVERGYNVTGIDNLERSTLLEHKVSEERKNFNWEALRKMGVDMRWVDISQAWGFDILPKKGYDIVVHLAGQCGVPTSINNPKRDFEVNTVGTFNVLEFVRKQGAGRVVYASTNKTYPLHGGWSKWGDKWEWTDPKWRKTGFPIDAELQYPDYLGGARTPYGNSKYMGELLMQEWHHTYGIPTGCFRMSCIYGPNQFGFEEQGWATWFVIAFLKGLPLTIYGDGCQVRDMLYVEDLVRAYDAFAQSTTVNHGIWNTGGGPNNTLSLNECIDFLSKELNCTVPVNYADWRPSDQRIYTSDIRPLKLDLGWEPTVSPQDGLRKVIEWVKPNLEVF